MDKMIRLQVSKLESDLFLDLRLRQLGLDSISAVFLKGRLSELFGGSLPGTGGSGEVRP